VYGNGVGARDGFFGTFGLLLAVMADRVIIGALDALAPL